MDKVYIVIYDEVQQTWLVAKRNRYEHPEEPEEYYVVFLRNIFIKEDAMNVAHAMNETLV